MATLRAALRALRAAPGYVTLAVLTLAVGIGATTAIVSVADALLLRPLPYADAERLVAVWSRLRAQPDDVPPSYPDFADWRAAAARPGSPVADMAFARSEWMLLRQRDGAVTVNAAWVSDGFFRVVGGRAMLGRTLLPQDERPGAPRVAVLGWRLWQKQFGGDPAVVGRTLPFAQGGFTVVGVMPPGYEYPGLWAEMWSPLAPHAAADPALAARLGRRGVRVDARVIARLAPGATPAAARAALAATSRAIAEAHPAEGRGWGADAVPLREEMTRGVRRPLLVLLGAVGLLLLVACADVANLTLVRASGRARELAVRAAMGGTRARLAAQLLAESAAVAAAGAALGALLAAGGVRVLRAVGAEALGAGFGSQATLDAARVDGRVLAAAAALAALTALLFGLAPALRGARADAGLALRDGARGADAAGAGRRFRAAVAVAQVAVTLVLLVGAGLLGRSFLELRARAPGFELERLVVLRVEPSEARYRTPGQLAELFARVREAAAAVPGARAAGVVQHMPMTGAGIGTPIALPGRAPDDSMRALYRLADDGFFAATRIPIRRGRALEAADMAAAARPGAADVPAVVSAELARRAWPRGDALGQRFTAYRQASGRADYDTPVPAVVVGVAGDVRVRSLEEGGWEPTVYLPFTANPWRWGTLVVRADGNPAALVNAVRAAVRRVDADIPVAAATTGSALLGRTFVERRFQLALVGTFAAAALLLAAVGLYGVLATGVALRRGELGVRAALGAARPQLLAMVLRDGARLAAAGLAAGLALALGAARALEGLVFGIGVRDAATYAAVALLLLTVALAASWLPARRAARVDPAEALKGGG